MKLIVSQTTQKKGIPFQALSLGLEIPFLSYFIVKINR